MGRAENPASAISLRAIDPERYTIVNEADGTVMEEIEESKAFWEVYDGAVYLFQVGPRQGTETESHRGSFSALPLCGVVGGREILERACLASHVLNALLYYVLNMVCLGVH